MKLPPVVRCSRFLLLPIFTSAAMFAKPPADLPSRLEAFNAASGGGVALAWVDPDGAAFFQSGKFDASDARLITPDTVFELGSISKVFTALLLAESEKAGKVSRDDPVAKFLLPPADPAQAALAKITLLRLTTHMAGLPRLPANIGPNPDANPNPYAHYDRAALVEGLRLHGPSAPVGRAMVYSNFGVALLGEALASAWSTTYSEALQAHVLTPLGMKNTSVGLTEAVAPAELAPAHANGKRVMNWTQLAFAGAGAVRSSARDMSLFLEACLGEKVSPLHDSFEQTFQPQNANEDGSGHVGLGWMLVDDPDNPIIWHSGATAGSHSVVAFNPKTKTGLVMLMNFQKAPEPLAFALLGTKLPQPVVAKVTNATEYLGNYPLSPAFSIQVTESGGALFAQATRQPKLALRATATDRFAVGGAPAEVSFERDATGKISGLVLHQNGLDQKAPRHELEVVKEIALPAEQVQEYPGDYPLAPTFILTVSEESGALFVQASGQSKFRVYASAKDEFFYNVVDAKISFTRDTNGKVSGLVLHQNGRDLPGKKATP